MMIARCSLSFLARILAVLAIAAGAALLGGCASRPGGATATPTLSRLLATWTSTPARATPAAAQPSPTLTLLPPLTATPTARPATATHTPLPTATIPPATATTTPTATATTAPTATPTRTPSPKPPAPTRPAATATPAVQARAWDARLTQRGAVLIPAQPQPGQGYWRLVAGQWFDVNDPPFAGKNHIFVDTLDAAGKRQTGVPLRLSSPDGKAIYGYIGTEAKPGEPYAASFAMRDVAPAYRVEPADGAPADAVTGLGLGSIEIPGLAILTSYGFTWQWTVAGQMSPSAPASAAGSAPEHALPIPGYPQRLAVGQRIWFAFRYAGDNSEVLVKMTVDPPGAASFAVWAPSDVLRWKQDGRESPIGRGTPNEAAGGALVWDGRTYEAGVYYVVVDQTGQYTGSFALTVSGAGVSPAGQ